MEDEGNQKKMQIKQVVLWRMKESVKQANYGDDDAMEGEGST